MVVQTRVAHAQEVFIIGLPFDGVFGQGLLVIFHRQRFLKHIDMHFFSGQISLSIEQEVAKASIASRSRGSGSHQAQKTLDTCSLVHTASR